MVALSALLKCCPFENDKTSVQDYFIGGGPGIVLSCWWLGRYVVFGESFAITFRWKMRCLGKESVVVTICLLFVTLC